MTALRLTSAVSRRRQRRRSKMARKIFKQQLSTQPVLPKVSFGRLVREIMGQFSDDVVNVRGEGMHALQCAAEEHVTKVFSDAARLAQYCNRDTVTSADVRFVGHGECDYAPMQLPDHDEDGPDGYANGNSEVSGYPLSELAPQIEA